MQVEVVKWGNSSAVRLPAALLKQARLALGDKLEIKTEDGKLVLEPSAPEYQLDKMLAGITPNNRHVATDFGAPVGREAW